MRANPGHYLVSASLVDERGFKWAVRDAEPADGMYPTWMWSSGQQVRDQLRLAVPAETPPGRYRVALRILQDGRPLSVIGANGNPAGGQANLSEIELSRTETAVKPREIKGVTARRSIKVNDDLEVAASDFGRTELRPGETSDITLVWHALRDVRRDYNVRLSLFGPNNAVLGQSPTQRVAGEAIRATTGSATTTFAASSGWRPPPVRDQAQ